MQYALDTNIVIHLMRGSRHVRKNLEDAKKAGALFVIPPVVNYEIRRGLIIKQIAAHEKAYSVICNNCSLGEMTKHVWERAAQIYAELYSKRLTVNDADILIAAFCLTNDFMLVTANTKDFENIDDLHIINWVN